MKLIQRAKYFFRFVLSNRRRKYGTVFDGQESFSSNFQDVAVFNLFGGKKSGTYIEIGSQDPIKCSNTFALEINHNWRGLSFEIDDEYVNFFNWCRKNTCIKGDATTHDYVKIFSKHELPQTIDYLQLDIDPPSASLATLKSLPFDRFTFSFIAFEHDSYQFGEDVAKAQRQILSSAGYVLLAQDVSHSGGPFEDWWISADLAQSMTQFGRLPLSNLDGARLAKLLRNPTNEEVQ
ncbi:MAG: hypothetical protein LRY53_09380 [Burkholderiaceae bacterium]|nr:hypothetical protein [Burkholderiaceae bacterium]MCD8538162.1 hypothetical protein [Burkholderiaceae bacterium]MCD8565821.1 hypothetical protein [Burkholderiaceae bacterium]